MILIGDTWGFTNDDIAEMVRLCDNPLQVLIFVTELNKGLDLWETALQ